MDSMEAATYLVGKKDEEELLSQDIALDSIAVPLFTNSETAAVTPLRRV